MSCARCAFDGCDVSFVGNLAAAKQGGTGDGVRLYCAEHHAAVFGARCAGCWEPIVPGAGRKKMKVGDHQFHKGCLQCCVCAAASACLLYTSPSPRDA